MRCRIFKTRADTRKLVAYLESAPQIYLETCLTFKAPKYVLACELYSNYSSCALQPKQLNRFIRLIGLLVVRY